MKTYKAYKVFTVSHGHVEEGAFVDAFSIKNAGVTIPAILFGEQGRGRKLGVLPLDGCPTPTEGYPICLKAASVGQTRSGKPKLFVADRVTNTESVLVVLHSRFGYRGGNEHTGDRASQSCCKYGCSGTAGPKHQGPCPVCGGEDMRLSFHPMPGEVLCDGRIAQGGAGRMGSGTQLCVLLPAGEVLRISRSGRLYGAPSAHYLQWDGESLMSVTWEERQLTDIF